MNFVKIKSKKINNTITIHHVVKNINISHRTQLTVLRRLLII